MSRKKISLNIYDWPILEKIYVKSVGKENIKFLNFCEGYV